MVEHGEVLAALSSSLIDLAEIGDLADLAVTAQINLNGRTHAPGCRMASAKATPARTMTIAELREAASADWEPCRQCGGGVLGRLSGEQRERAEELIAVRRSRAETARQEAISRRRAEEDKRVADAIDKRVENIVSGWEWEVAKEQKLAAGYPAGILSAQVPCDDCEAGATITFEPRTLRITYACPNNPEHGYYRREDSDGGTILRPLWPYRAEAKYVAIAMVAPVFSGKDDTWQRVYGTRVNDYRRCVKAVEEFAAAHPEPMRLIPDVRCGDCGKTMDAHRAVEQIQASYSCDARHADGKYRSYAKADVDGAIDRELISVLGRHQSWNLALGRQRSWSVAPELEPAAEKLAGYAEYLTSKIAAYDEHAGAAAEDPGLARQRRELGDKLDLVTAMREQGALAAAGLTGYVPTSWYPREPVFSDLARALLTDHVEVTEAQTSVFTRFDEGTELYCTLRVRDIRDELADLERRRLILTAELAEFEPEVLPITLSCGQRARHSQSPPQPDRNY